MKNITVIISSLILVTILSSAFKNKSKEQIETKPMLTEYITLNNNEVFKAPLYIKKNCLDFSDLTINTPNILIRSQETDVKYTDLLKIGIERAKNLSNQTFEDLWNCECNYGASDNKSLASDAKWPYGVDACYDDKIQFSEQVWDEKYSKYRGTYYDIDWDGDKFANLFKKLFNNDIAINWIMNDLVRIYKQVSYQYTDDWKYSMIQSLSELESFMKTFNQNKSNYKAIANNPKLKLQKKIGANQAFLYRRITNDGISEKNATIFISKMKSAIKSSLKNGYSHYKDYIVNDGKLIISLKIISKQGTNMITLKSKNSEKHIDFELGDIDYIKCLKEDGKDYFLISDCDPTYCKESKPKQILIDENFNILSNTY